MKTCESLPASVLEALPEHRGGNGEELREALAALDRKIVVLDDDPTGVWRRS